MKTIHKPALLLAAAGCTATPELSAGTTLATLDMPRNIFADGERAYVSDRNGVVKIELDSGAQTMFISSDRAAVWAMDEGYLYASQEASPDASVVAQTFRAPKDGGGIVPLLDAAVAPVSVDDLFAYWPAANPPALMRISKAGGTPESLAVIADPTGFGVDSMVVDSTYVYWTVYVPDSRGLPVTKSVQRALKTGGIVEVLTNSAAAFTQLAVDVAAVYWVAFDGRTNYLVRFDKQTEVITTLSAEVGIWCPFSQPLISDGSQLYWVGDGRILKTTGADAGNPSAVAGVRKTCVSMAVGNSALFWVTIDDSSTGAGSLHVLPQ